MDTLRDETDAEMGNDTNQDTQLYSRVCSAHQDLGRPRLGAQGQRSSCSESENPCHTRPSTDSMQTTPPTGHALQTPISLKLYFQLVRMLEEETIPLLGSAL